MRRRECSPLQSTPGRSQSGAQILARSEGRIANQLSLGRVAPTTSFIRRRKLIFCADTPKRAPPAAGRIARIIVLALAFGVLIVFLVITGSIWIIANLNSNMMPMPPQ